MKLSSISSQIGFGQLKPYSKTTFGNVTRPEKANLLENIQEADSFESQNTQFDKNDASNDGKFTAKEAIKNFGKGLISPIKAVIDHPLIAIGAIAATGLACFAIPALTPVLTVGFGALSLFEIGKGTYNAVKNYKNGDYDASEKSFEKIGTGTIGAILTAVGLKSSAKVAAEVKQANTLGRALTRSEKIAISQKVQEGSFLSALKENLSMFTTAEGRSALAANFKPSSIAAQFKKVVSAITPKSFKDTAEYQRRQNMSTKDVEREVTEVINQAFDEMGIPQEARPKIVIQDDLKYHSIDDANELVSKLVDERLYIDSFGSHRKGTFRREFFNPNEDLSKMSNEEILGRIKAILEQSDDTQKLCESETFLKSLLNEQRPNQGGCYTPKNHEIVFKTGGWREGNFVSTEEIATHEALHAKMSILRNSLTKEEAAQIIKQELINRIRFGEAEEIIVEGSFLGNRMMPAPKMTPQMRAEYAQFADDVLYKSDEIARAITQRDTILYRIAQYNKGEPCGAGESIIGLNSELIKVEQRLEPVLTRLRTMMRNNPEFIAQNGSSESEALKVLLDYTKSHEIRFKFFSNTKINGLEPIPLTPEQHEQAVKSLVGFIETAEGNSRTNGIFTQLFGASREQFNQYQFSYEELLARNTAAQFEKAKIQAMLRDTSISAEKQAELTARLAELDLILEYNRVGKQYYDLYIQVLNNPNDAALAERLNAITPEFERLGRLKANGGVNVAKNGLKTVGHIPANMLPYLPKKEAA